MTDTNLTDAANLIENEVGLILMIGQEDTPEKEEGPGPTTETPAESATTEVQATEGPTDDAVLQGTVMTAETLPAVVTMDASKVKPAKGKKSGTTFLPPDIISQAAHVIENLDAQGAFAMANELLDGSEFNTFKLGGVLLRVNSEKYFTTIGNEGKGYESFKEFVEIEYGFKYRKAMYLVEIYSAVIELNLTWDKIKHIGWTKLKTLLNSNLNLVTAENIDGWIKKAEGMTVLQLESAVKGATSNNGQAIENDPGKEVTTMTFKLHPDQKDVLRTALEKAKEQGGFDTDTVALEMIATQFLGSPGFTTSTVSAEPVAATTFDGVSMAETFATLGYAKVLEFFEQAFPTIELSVSIPEEGDPAF